MQNLRIKELAEVAYRNQSFSPEKIAKSVYENYLEDCKKFGEIGVDTEKLTRLYTGWLNAESRCASPVITGPAWFQVARMRKYREWELKKWEKLKEYKSKILSPKPKADIIKQSDNDAVDKLKEKLSTLIEKQAQVKASKDRRHAFELQYLTRDIREIKKKIELLEINKQRPDKEIQIGDIKVVQSWTDNRVRLFFDGKPDDNVRLELKRNGFRWTPSLGCWQAYNNSRSVGFVMQELKALIN